MRGRLLALCLHSSPNRVVHKLWNTAACASPFLFPFMSCTTLAVKYVWPGGVPICCACIETVTLPSAHTQLTTVTLSLKRKGTSRELLYYRNYYLASNHASQCVHAWANGHACLVCLSGGRIACLFAHTMHELARGDNLSALSRELIRGSVFRNPLGNSGPPRSGAVIPAGDRL